MKIDLLSDLHGFKPDLPGGDLLIIAGDLTARDKQNEYLDFFSWLMHQDYKKKIFIGGNHDVQIQNRFVKFDENSTVDYLEDSGTEFEGLKIWGTPWTQTFKYQNPACKAFALNSEEKLKQKWDLIPDGIDILITHSPPCGILDKTIRCRTGSITLYDAIERVQPRLHVFGHIHEGYGQKVTVKTHFVNASHVNEYYQNIHDLITIQW